MKDFSILKIIAAIGLVTGSCVVLTSLSGCGSSANTDAAPSPSEVLQTPGLKRSFELANDADVTCADSANCPENVGMIISANEDGVARCTGSLIAPDLVLTASRCVPPALRGEASCAERIRFLLPALSAHAPALPARQARCAQVLETGSIHALIRLDAPVAGRSPLKLDFSGVKDNLWVSVAAVSAVSDSKPFGELRVVKCAARQRTLAYPRFRTDESPVVSLENCRIGAAGAGAPVLSGAGSVRAVIGDALGPQASRELQKRYSAMLGDIPVSDLVEAANLSCIRFSADSGIEQPPLPSACIAPDVLPSPSSSLISADTMTAAHRALEARISRWQADRRMEIDWKLPVLASSLTQDIVPVPSCLSRPETWLGAYKHWYRRGGYDSKAELEFKVPRYRLSFVMNSSYQLQYLLKELEPTAIRMRFSPKQLAQEKTAQVTWGSGTAVLRPCR
jgi:hypothetical protein